MIKLVTRKRCGEHVSRRTRRGIESLDLARRLVYLLRSGGRRRNIMRSFQTISIGAVLLAAACGSTAVTRRLLGPRRAIRLRIRRAASLKHPARDVLEIGSELRLTHPADLLVGHEHADHSHDIHVQRRIDPGPLSAVDAGKGVLACRAGTARPVDQLETNDAIRSLSNTTVTVCPSARDFIRTRASRRPPDSTCVPRDHARRRASVAPRWAELAARPLLRIDVVRTGGPICGRRACC
jgi:hypothetical protein